MSKKNNKLFYEGRIEKSVPRDHCLTSLGKPRDAKRRSSGRIFLPYPHTHGRFLYYSKPPGSLSQQVPEAKKLDATSRYNVGLRLFAC